jgi:hypothetical protein
MAPMSEPSAAAPKGALDAPPTGAARTMQRAGLALWIVVMIAVPLRYYVGGDTYDERFSWRMFSAVRVQECAIDAREVVCGREQTITLMESLPAPWVALLQRNRPAVLRRFLRWRCASDAQPSEVRLTHTCRDASGDALPPIRRVMDCSTHTIEETSGEGTR